MKEHQDTYMSAAAYNGSPQALRRWRRDFGHLKPEIFVERIPYKETRDYVKKVLTTQAIYRGLEGLPLHLDLPFAPPGPGQSEITAFEPVENSEKPAQKD